MTECDHSSCIWGYIGVLGNRWHLCAARHVWNGRPVRSDRAAGEAAQLVYRGAIKDTAKMRLAFTQASLSFSMRA